jgi:hypothetical protein
MTEYYSCPKCRKIVPIVEGREKKCLSCGDTNGEILSQEQVDKGMEGGVYFNMGPDRKPRKKPRK